jgi:drug/metabolite transporter (DMT)-like permease
MGPIYTIYAASVTLVLYIYGLIFHNEIPNKNSIIGAIFILIGLYLVNNR